MILELLGKNIYVYVTPFLGGVKEINNTNLWHFSVLTYLKYTF